MGWSQTMISAYVQDINSQWTPCAGLLYWNVLIICKITLYSEWQACLSWRWHHLGPCDKLPSIRGGNPLLGHTQIKGPLPRSKVIDNGSLTRCKSPLISNRPQCPAYIIWSSVQTNLALKRLIGQRFPPETVLETSLWNEIYFASYWIIRSENLTR